MSKMIDTKNPFEQPAFLEGLEAAGYLQRLDTSETRITARFQHGLSKVGFAAYSEEFCNIAGVRKVHGSTVHFFTDEDDVVADPYVHVLVDNLPSSRQHLVQPHGTKAAGWTPINSKWEAEGTMHFTVSVEGFWPLTVVFDSNHDIGREDKYALADEGYESSDPQAHLRSARGSRRASSRSRRASAYDSESGSESDDGGYRSTYSRGGGGSRSAGRYAGGGSGGGALRRSSSRASMRDYANTDNRYECDAGYESYRSGRARSDGGGLGRSSSRARSASGRSASGRY